MLSALKKKWISKISLKGYAAGYKFGYSSAYDHIIKNIESNLGGGDFDLKMSDVLANIKLLKHEYVPKAHDMVDGGAKGFIAMAEAESGKVH